jgi:hypothetical protein
VTDLPVRTFEYSADPGCQGETCASWRPATVETEEVRHDPMTGYRLAEPYTVRKVSPQCARTPECAARRYAIYTKAQEAVDAVYQSGLTFRGANRKTARLWEEITAEYKSQPCPFFEPAN